MFPFEVNDAPVLGIRPPLRAIQTSCTIVVETSKSVLTKVKYEEFFVKYNELQGKKFQPLGCTGRTAHWKSQREA